jgi:hypothetical protein
MSSVKIGDFIRVSSDVIDSYSHLAGEEFEVVNVVPSAIIVVKYSIRYVLLDGEYELIDKNIVEEKIEQKVSQISQSSLDISINALKLSLRLLEEEFRKNKRLIRDIKKSEWWDAVCQEAKNAINKDHARFFSKNREDRKKIAIALKEIKNAKTFK